MNTGDPIDSPIPSYCPDWNPHDCFRSTRLLRLRSFHPSVFPPIGLVVLLFYFCTPNPVVLSVVRVNRRCALAGNTGGHHGLPSCRWLLHPTKLCPQLGDRTLGGSGARTRRHFGSDLMQLFYSTRHGLCLRRCHRSCLVLVPAPADETHTTTPWELEVSRRDPPRPYSAINLIYCLCPLLPFVLLRHTSGSQPCSQATAATAAHQILTFVTSCT